MLTKLILAPLLILSSVINSLGLRLLGVLGYGLGSLLYYCGFRKKIVMGNLELALGQELTLQEREVLARKIYTSVGTLFLEIARNFSMGPDQMREEMTVSAADLKKLKDIQAQGKGSVILSGHLGNWELFAMGMASHGFPVAIVVKKMSSGASQALIEQRRAVTGMSIIYPGGTIARMTEALREGKMVGFMVDQHINGKNGIRTNFFGVPAASIRGLAKLAKDTGSPVVPVCAFRLPNGKHQVKVLEPLQYLQAEELPEGSPERLAREEWINTQQYQKAAEDLVRLHPEQWLWIHRRWKANRDPLPVNQEHKEQML